MPTSVVVWFYEPPGGQGVLLSFQTSPYPTTPYDSENWLYIGPDVLDAHSSTTAICQPGVNAEDVEIMLKSIAYK